MSGRFAAKRVVITGAGSGIGRACAERFASEGATVCALDIDRESAQRTADNLGAGHLAASLDVTDAAEITRVIGELAAHGLPDILINSAGIREIVSCLELDPGQWAQVIAVNLTGTFLVSQAVARQMVDRGTGGKIVNLASVAGLTAVPNRAAYVASKHGVVGLTKEMAMELGPHNIQVNAVGPGVVETGMTAGYFDDEALAASIRKMHSAGRWAQPHEIAAVICFLASNEADFITGATYPVDGGFLAGKGF